MRRRARARASSLAAASAATRSSRSSAAAAWAWSTGPAIPSWSGPWRSRWWLGHWDLALADYGRALALFEVGGKVDRRGIITLVGIGRTHLEAGRPAKAIAPLERAVAVAKPEKFAGMQLVGKWLLGRAQVESRQDVAGGHAAIQAARAELAAAGGSDAEIAELDAWVAKARKR